MKKRPTNFSEQSLHDNALYLYNKSYYLGQKGETNDSPSKLTTSICFYREQIFCELPIKRSYHNYLIYLKWKKRYDSPLHLLIAENLIRDITRYPLSQSEMTYTLNYPKIIFTAIFQKDCNCFHENMSKPKTKMVILMKESIVCKIIGLFGSSRPK